VVGVAVTVRLALTVMVTPIVSALPPFGVIVTVPVYVAAGRLPGATLIDRAL
jgi:hypothetical protein